MSVIQKRKVNPLPTFSPKPSIQTHHYDPFGSRITWRRGGEGKADILIKNIFGLQGEGRSFKIILLSMLNFVGHNVLASRTSVYPPYIFHMTQNQSDKFFFFFFTRI